MNKVSFRCENCGEVSEQNIMPMKHAVLGTAYKINQEAECCETPRYTDHHGYVKKTGSSSRSFLSRIGP
jgi:hypothetical protein